MAILAEGTVEDESPAFTPEEFREKPPVLELSGVSRSRHSVQPRGIYGAFERYEGLCRAESEL